MKQTVNVNISGIAFTLDQECYVMLNTFLDQTRLSVISHSDRDQIMADIEARIAEEILSDQSAEQPVSQATIRPIIERMGGRSDSFDPTTSQQEEPAQSNATLRKRLFRNPNGAILGGVCNGMASYFNTDVALLRIIFLIPIFTMLISSLWNLYVIGQIFASLNVTSILLYLILWVVIPKARTPREKLEMKGEPITVEAISSHPDSSVSSPSPRSASVLSVILKVIAIAFGLSLLVSAIVLAFVGLFVFSAEMSVHPNPVPDILNVLNLSFSWAVIWAMTLTLLPVIAIFYLILGSCLSWKRVGLVVGLIFMIWFALAIWALILVTFNMPQIASIVESFNYCHYR